MQWCGQYFCYEPITITVEWFPKNKKKISQLLESGRFWFHDILFLDGPFSHSIHISIAILISHIGLAAYLFFSSTNLATSPVGLHHHLFLECGSHIKDKMHRNTESTSWSLYHKIIGEIDKQLPPIITKILLSMISLILLRRKINRVYIYFHRFDGWYHIFRQFQARIQQQHWAIMIKKQ